MDSSFDRRTFLGAGAVAAGALTVLADPLAAAEASRRRIRRAQVPLAREGAFSQGVASGQPGPREITLWTRVDGLSRTSKVGLEVSPDPDFRRIVHRANLNARQDEDFTVRTRLEGRGLRPGEQYFYRFSTCASDSRVGRFRTALPADSREPVRIAFFSCQDFQEGFYTAHAGLAAEPDIDLVVCLGDYVYEKAFFTDPVREDRTAPDGETQTLAEYRRKYSLYHSDPNLRAVRANFPMMAIWDDHEVEDNYAADRPGGAAENRRVPFAQRKANGYRAFSEYMPRVRSRFERDRIYGSRRLGGNLEVFLLDERQYRDDQPCSPGDDFIAPTCPPSERDAPGRTLLGAKQKRELLRTLETSRSRWKVVANQVMVMSLDVPARNPINPDSWDGYGAERRELLEFIQAKGIKDVSFITGDIHTFFAGNVTPSGREGVPAVDGVPVATEFVGGSVTSQGIADRLGEDRAPAIAFPSDAGVLANNPHIKYSNQAFKGYAVLEARPDELLVEYRSPRTIKRDRSEVFTLQGFRVRSGEARVQPEGAVLERRPPRSPLAAAAQAGRGPAGCAADRGGDGRAAPRFTG